MELLQVLLSSITLFIFLLAIYKFTFLTPNKKHLPPSPPGALPIIGHLRLLSLPTPLHRTLQTLSTNSHQYAHYMFLKLGVRNLLVLSSPAAIQEWFHKNDVAFANRPRSIAGDYTSYDYTNLVFANYWPIWRDQRRIITSNFLSPSSLSASSDIRRDAVRWLLKDLHKSSSINGCKPQKIDLKLKFFQLTFNSVMSMSTGEPIGDGFCYTEKNKWFIDLLQNRRTPSLVMIPGDYLPLLRCLDLFKMEKRVAATSKERDAYVEEIVERFRKQVYMEKKFKSVLDLSFSLHRVDPDHYNHQSIKGLLLSVFAAGIDTSAITLEWAMSLLLNHPEVLKKALYELDNNIEPHCFIEDSDLSNLPYIQSIIKETLRLYLPAPFLLPHEAAHECKVDQYNVPKGTIVVANVLAVHRNPKVWPEPDKFIPERFMQSVQHGESKDEFKFIPFGTGRRGCPGEGLAMLTLTLALGSLLRCFEWEKIEDEPIDMSEANQFFMLKEKPLEALCRPRSKMLSVLRHVSSN